MIVYAGKFTTCRKVAEFGGNSCGVGSRGVVRLGWPKEPLKVEGEAVTFSFQVKSARERSTPDQAVWGFSCTVSSKVRRKLLMIIVIIIILIIIKLW